MAPPTLPRREFDTQGTYMIDSKRMASLDMTYLLLDVYLEVEGDIQA